MHIHTDSINVVSLAQAAHEARTLDGQDIYVYDVTEHGSRKRQRRLDVYAESTSGKYASAHDQSRRSASWDAYGYLIARLFNQDAHAHIGQYKGVNDFIGQCSAEMNRLAISGRVTNDHTGAFLALV